MTDRERGDTEHEEILSLLPWYANRTLCPEETSSVSRHLTRCEECRDELRFLESLNVTARDDAEDRHRAHADTETALASVMGRIDAETGPADAKEPWRSVLKGAIERMLPRPLATPGVRWGATALAGLLVAVLAVQVYRGEVRDDYSVLSSPDVERAPMRLIVEVASASERERARSVIEDALEKLSLRADVDASADGAHVVEFGDGIDVDDLNELIVELEDETGIERVELLP